MTTSDSANPFASRGTCNCTREHAPELVVVTGGPGAGKTAVLEMVSRIFCPHVAVLPEAASIVFSGGFPRLPSRIGRQAVQRSIFHIQRELESIAQADPRSALALCDRGTVDGLAYWPDVAEGLWSSVGTTHQAELARYAAVIHLRTPSARNGYNHQNRWRIESPAEAAAIDLRIEECWSSHPRRFVIDSSESFLVKATAAIQRIESLLPNCCRPSVATTASPEPRGLP